MLNVTLFGLVGAAGGLILLVHQGIMKITLFFRAGNYAETPAAGIFADSSISPMAWAELIAGLEYLKIGQ